MECLLCARQGCRYFVQIGSSKNSYKIDNIRATFKMRQLRPRRVKQQSWSHTARKWQNWRQSGPEPVLPPPPRWVLLHPTCVLVPHVCWTLQGEHQVHLASKMAMQKSCLPCRFGLKTATPILTWLSSLLAHPTDFKFASPHNGVGQSVEINLSR